MSKYLNKMIFMFYSYVMDAPSEKKFALFRAGLGKELDQKTIDFLSFLAASLLKYVNMQAP